MVNQEEHRVAPPAGTILRYDFIAGCIHCRIRRRESNITKDMCVAMLSVIRQYYCSIDRQRSLHLDAWLALYIRVHDKRHYFRRSMVSRGDHRECLAPSRRLNCRNMYVCINCREGMMNGGKCIQGY